MKQIFTSLLLLVAVTISYAQQIKPPEPLSAEVYRKKAKDQRVAALVLGGAGLVSMFYGFSHFQFFANKQDDKTTVPVITGLVLLGSTIPLIIIADKNAKKAKTISTSFILQQTPPLVAAVKSINHFPSVSIKIRL